jgi:protein-S-isoprenylcysteine O-methyltransferase Ste14
MIRLSIFIVISVFIVCVSRNSLLHLHCHGFARFFAWESILALILLNILNWFKNPFSPAQLVSWLFLIISIFLVAHGMHLLRVVGKPNRNRSDPELFKLERTSTLVTTGIYRYIRHPLYSSLLFLAWGAFLKYPAWIGLYLALFSSVCLFFTAKTDEYECLHHFGREYQEYMLKTKRFIPFLF